MSNTPDLLAILLKSIDDAQATDIVTIDVSKHTSVTDYMIICSGRSSRHVKAIVEQAMEAMKNAGHAALRNSGMQTGEWVLVDFGDYILHAMLPETRLFYDLEGHWQNS